MSQNQCTISKPISLKGVGLHTGVEVTLTLNPAPENHGFKFRRIDLDGSPIIEALAENVSFTQRGTVLRNGDATVSTIEHCLAALTGLGIQNCLIDLTGPEAPILDGSSKLFVEAIKSVGIKEQEEAVKYFIVKEKMVYENKESGVKIVAMPDDEYNIDALISFDSSKYLANQFASLSTISDFEKEISSCRTFVFLHEMEMLLQHNLIKGGDMDNAIVIVDREIAPEEVERLAKLFSKPGVTITSTGILNNIELEFPNEMARHKLLDVIGDLSLIGLPIKGKIIATRPGHFSNVEFAKIIRKEIKKRMQKDEAPYYNPNDKPIFDINAIKSFLPHRPPFLLIDKIISIDKKTIVGVKNVTLNEPFFVGHFPDEPVMPAVLQIEAMAQCGGILVLSTLPDPENYSTYFLKIDNVKMRKKVVPGDTLIFKLELISEIRRGVANMRGTAYVGNTVVSDGEFMAQIVKTKGL